MAYMLPAGDFEGSSSFSDSIGSAPQEQRNREMGLATSSLGAQVEARQRAQEYLESKRLAKQQQKRQGGGVGGILGGLAPLAGLIPGAGPFISAGMAAGSKFLG